MDDNTVHRVVVTPEPAEVKITPYALAMMSDDMHKSSQGYKPVRFPLINYYLYAASIELGLKSAILSVECSEQKKKQLKNIGHNLEELIAVYEAEVNSNFFKASETQVVLAVNKYFSNKSLEYFTETMLEAALRGFTSFPNIKDLEKVSEKVNNYLEANKFFLYS